MRQRAEIGRRVRSRVLFYLNWTVRACIHGDSTRTGSCIGRRCDGTRRDGRGKGKGAIPSYRISGRINRPSRSSPSLSNNFPSPRPFLSLNSSLSLSVSLSFSLTPSRMHHVETPTQFGFHSSLLRAEPRDRYNTARTSLRDPSSSSLFHGPLIAFELASIVAGRALLRFTLNAFCTCKVSSWKVIL